MSALTPNIITAPVPSIEEFEYAQIVYVDTTDPNTATIFDLTNPPATNDDTLKADTANLYVSTDRASWVYDPVTDTYNTVDVPVPGDAIGVHAILDATQSFPSDSTIMHTNMTTDTSNAGSAWNPAAGTFTAPEAGWYRLGYASRLSVAGGSISSNRNMFFNIAVNGINQSQAYERVPNSVTNYGFPTVRATINYYLSVGDVVTFSMLQRTGTTRTLVSDDLSNRISIVKRQG